MKLFTVTALLAIATQIHGKTFWVTETSIETVTNTEHWYKTTTEKGTKVDFDPAETTINSNISESADIPNVTTTEPVNKRAASLTNLVSPTETTRIPFTAN